MPENIDQEEKNEEIVEAEETPAVEQENATDETEVAIECTADEISSEQTEELVEEKEDDSNEELENNSDEALENDSDEEQLAVDGELLPVEEEPMSPKMLEMHATLSLRVQVEAAIFAAPKPIKPADLIDLVSHQVSLKEMESQIDEIREDFETRQGGFSLQYVKGLGFQFQSAAAAGPMMERMFASRPRPLSRAALETLSIVAYRQPCTRAAVEFIRGVDSGSIMKGLLERDLVRCTGRKEDAGRPMLFGTTDEFLHVFGLTSIKELPPLHSFQPDSDTMQQALQELEDIDNTAEVDIEDFVGDEDDSLPEVSEGLISGSEVESLETSTELTEPVLEESAENDEEISENTDLESQESLEEAELICDESSVEKTEHIEGAVRADDSESDEDEFAEDGSGSDRDGEDPEVAIPDGDLLTTGSGSLDSPEKDFS